MKTLFKPFPKKSIKLIGYLDFTTFVKVKVFLYEVYLNKQKSE